MVIVSTAPPETALRPYLQESAVRHKHLCPRQVLGVRIGLRGLLALGLIDETYQPFDNKNKRLLTIVEMDGCGADGISVATDCQVGRRTLRILDYGKMAATLIDAKAGQAVRVWPRPEIRQTAGQYAPDARSRWYAYLEAYQIIPDEELLHVQPVELTQPLAAILSRPNVRVTCDQCGEEIMNEREVMVDACTEPGRSGRTLCQPCAGDSYYVIKPSASSIARTIN
jgi:formylmethanofuran dehydrogenase subunit E